MRYSKECYRADGNSATGYALDHGPANVSDVIDHIYNETRCSCEPVLNVQELAPYPPVRVAFMPAPEAKQ